MHALPPDSRPKMGTLPEMSVGQGTRPRDVMLRFETFRLDRRGGLVRECESGQWEPVALGSRALELLFALAERHGELVTKSTLIDAVWPDIAVGDNNLTVQISVLRRHLDGGRAGGSCIQTIIGRGYRFLPLVSTQAVAPPLLNVSTDASRPGAAANVASSVPSVNELTGMPSVAVLPFTNLSDDREQEYFSDGVADDIITELSRNRSLFVIARNSGFTFKDYAIDVKKVGQELDVRYVVQGSVRRDANRIRIVAQLISAESGAHIWAERFDRDLADFFAVQDEITRAVVTAIDPAIAHAERARAMRKPPGSLSAWEAWQRALWHWSKGGDFSIARDFLLQAISMDPRFAPPHAMLAWLHTTRSTLAVGLPLRESVKLSEIEARTAIELDPRSSLAHAMLAWVFDHQGDRSAALEESETAIVLNANDPQGHLSKARVLILSGRPAEARESLATALRLDPRGPTAPSVMQHRCMGCYLERDYRTAETMSQRAMRAFPESPRPWLWLTATLGQLGRDDEARAALDTLIVGFPDYFKFITGGRPVYFRPEDHEHLLDGLRLAGWRA